MLGMVIGLSSLVRLGQGAKNAAYAYTYKNENFAVKFLKGFDGAMELFYANGGDDPRLETVAEGARLAAIQLKYLEDHGTPGTWSSRRDVMPVPHVSSLDIFPSISSCHRSPLRIFPPSFLVYSIPSSTVRSHFEFSPS